MWCWPAVTEILLQPLHIVFTLPVRAKFDLVPYPAISLSLTDTKHEKIAVAQGGGILYFMGAFHLFYSCWMMIFIYCSSADSGSSGSTSHPKL